MFIVLGLWAFSLVAGLCWARLWTAFLCLLTLAAFALLDPAHFFHWTGIWQAIVLGFTPWLFAAQQNDKSGVLRLRQQEQADRAMKLSETARAQLNLSAAVQQLETQITNITELYHVTKETSRALSPADLFRLLIELVPQMLQIKGLRLVFPLEPPEVFRAHPAEDGRMRVTHHGSPDRIERRIIDEFTQSDHGGKKGTSVHLMPQENASPHLTWTALTQDNAPIGALIAEDLLPTQETTFRIIANQLALQCSRVRLYQQVEALAVTDALTGLYVRRRFLERAQDELIRCRRHNLACAVLMVDLDHFKQKNDTYGHLVGDAILRDVAKLLQRHMRDVDSIARYGGEEFILLLIETDASQALPVAQRLRQLVEVHPVQAYDELISQTISVGIAAFPEHAENLQALIDAADRALLAAKRAGRNRVVTFGDPLMPH